MNLFELCKMCPIYFGLNRQMLFFCCLVICVYILKIVNAQVTIIENDLLKPKAGLNDYEIQP